MELLAGFVGLIALNIALAVVVAPICMQIDVWLDHFYYFVGLGGAENASKMLQGVGLLVSMGICFYLALRRVWRGLGWAWQLLARGNSAIPTATSKPTAPPADPSQTPLIAPLHLGLTAAHLRVSPPTSSRKPDGSPVMTPERMEFLRGRALLMVADDMRHKRGPFRDLDLTKDA